MKTKLRVAAGRPLPPLVWVTDKSSLARNIGTAEADEILAAVRATGARVIDALPVGGDAARAAARVRPFAAGEAGVVLLGGYDVVPSQRVDALPKSLRKKIRHSHDGDNFVIWNDDIYGDCEGDGWPELPVTRIPDGRSAALVRAAIGAARPRDRGRAGIRNLHRPFAELVFASIPGQSKMQESQPQEKPHRPRFSSERVYLMLHGSDADGRSFWGEDKRKNLREALHTGSIPHSWRGGVVFTGCCWGALTVDTPAVRVKPGRPVGARVVEGSMALSFLARGALAFVGCTGMHYSPLKPPFDYYGRPLHDSFWGHYNAGNSPARALFEAKREYAEKMPHGQHSHLSIAIEYKILREYTCLGLGF
jgi:hypothetical protein